jgi:multicomponent Na+:H+ antiporter subunit E
LKRIWHIFTLSLYFFWELIVSNLRIAWDVLRPVKYLSPGVIAVPLDLETDVEITLLSNLITLTPGTIGLDVSDDKRTLYIHAMHLRDGERVRRSIKEGFERRIWEITR